MSGVTIIMDPDNDKVKIDMFYLKKIFISLLNIMTLLNIINK